MAGRKIVDVAEARRLVRAVQRSGKSTGEWVRGRGIDGRSLQAWKMTVERGAFDAPKPRQSSRPAAKRQALIELVPKPVMVTRAAKYVIERDGVRLEFGDDFADDTLRRVLLVLRSC